MSLKSWWSRVSNKPNQIEKDIAKPEKEPKWCEHPKHLEEVINNGGIWCTVCGQTNLLKRFWVVDDDGEKLFNGNARACSKFVNKKNGYE